MDAALLFVVGALPLCFRWAATTRAQASQLLPPVACRSPARNHRRGVGQPLAPVAPFSRPVPALGRGHGPTPKRQDRGLRRPLNADSPGTPRPASSSVSLAAARTSTSGSADTGKALPRDGCGTHVQAALFIAFRSSICSRLPKRLKCSGDLVEAVLSAGAPRSSRQWDEGDPCLGCAGTLRAQCHRRTRGRAASAEWW
jgi:hypothetical protein